MFDKVEGIQDYIIINALINLQKLISLAYYNTFYHLVWEVSYISIPFCSFWNQMYIGGFALAVMPT